MGKPFSETRKGFVPHISETAQSEENLDRSPCVKVEHKYCSSMLRGTQCPRGVGGLNRHFVSQSWKIGLPQMRNDGRFECGHVS